MFLFNRRLPMTIKAKVLSFNPCFNGCFSSTVEVDDYYENDIPFQSLF